MKVLVLGGRGMAGHMIRDYLTACTPLEVHYTVRSRIDSERAALLLDARDECQVRDVLERVQPDVVINAVGLLNQVAARHPCDAVYLNALLPHWLSGYGDEMGFRLIHISTDCVFSGKRGNYRESDEKDGTSVYAQTKSLGEVINHPRHLTIRTSIVGPELKSDGIGLLHWFMQQSGTLSGYRKVFWNGVTTLQLAKTLEWVLSRPVSGVVHLTAPEQVSKLELLRLFQKVFGRTGLAIRPNDTVQNDKTLVNTREDFQVAVPGYEEMLTELRNWMASSR